ncbi:hypothetical protein [Nitratireductor rhodophyticola]|uniref:hypothetical protein n=1 Tax=Nitratireductor rhodophyticola TaxID=2854036 RepID=UPI00300AAD4B
MSSRKPWQITGAYVARRLDMLQSPAWRYAPRPMKALLEELEIEHLRHRGAANGELARSYTQFVEAGFKRNTVSEMIRVAEALGFLRVNRNSGIGPRDLRDAHLYTLTYLPTGVARNIAPTDDWKRIKSKEAALRIIENARQPQRRLLPQEVRGAA